MKIDRKTYIKTDGGFSLADKIFIKGSTGWQEAINVYQRFNGKWELVHCPGCELVWAARFPYFDKGSDAFHYIVPNLLDYILSLSPPWPREVFETAKFKVVVIIEENVKMLGPLTIDGFSSGSVFEIFNHGTIQGKAGKGGPALLPYQVGQYAKIDGHNPLPYLSKWSDLNGEDGGAAIDSQNDINLYNYGTLCGGAGGGHGGMPGMKFYLGYGRICHQGWLNWPSYWWFAYWYSHYATFLKQACDGNGWWMASPTMPQLPANVSWHSAVTYDVQHGANGGGGAGYSSDGSGGGGAGDYGGWLKYPGIEKRGLKNDGMTISWYEGLMTRWMKAVAFIITDHNKNLPSIPSSTVSGEDPLFLKAFGLIAGETPSERMPVTYDENANIVEGDIAKSVWWSMTLHNYELSPLSRYCGRGRIKPLTNSAMHLPINLGDRTLIREGTGNAGGYAGVNNQYALWFFVRQHPNAGLYHGPTMVSQHY